MNTQCSYFCLSAYLNIEIFYLLGTIAIKMQGFNFFFFPPTILATKPAILVHFCLKLVSVIWAMY